LHSLEAAAPSFGVQSVSTPIHDAVAVERALEGLARGSKRGLFVMPDATTLVHRDLIIKLAARHGIPAVYHQRIFVAHGGLISYGIDTADQFRQAATYIDRILQGAKPSELPVQGPLKFEMAINLKAAKALGLAVPLTLLARADEVIE
jgi:putative ABC transport system substrate-binding protein